mgnify:CR=1 FL=1
MSRAREIADLIGGPTPDIILKTADGAILNLQTSDTTVTDGSVLGAINFTAPNEGSGTDAITIGGAIQAVAEGTFAADNNATELVFMTGASEAATSKMVLSSGGNLTIAGDLTVNGDTTTFESANATDPVLIIKNTTNDADSARIRFVKDKGAAGADDDNIGTIEFFSDNAAQEQTQFALIRAEVAISNDGAEGGKLRLQVATHDGEMQSGLILADGNVEDEIDVQIAKGNASLTTIAGNATITSDLTVTGVSLFRDGTAGAPAISNTGDTNTGILFPSADAIGFSTAGTENLRLSTTNLSFASGGSAVSASNLVGVSFMIFSGQGQLRVGNSSTSAKNSVEFFNGNGQVGIIATNGSSTAYNTSSDYRLKENVDYSWDATTRLKQLKPARFNFIADADTTVDGFLAHEAATVVPDAVIGVKDATHVVTNVVLSASDEVVSQGITEESWTKRKADILYKENDIIPDGKSVGDVRKAAKFPSDSKWVATHTLPLNQQIDHSKIVPLLVKTIQELEARITTLEG